MLSDGRTVDYEYDAEERITRVTDSVEGVTEYTYDAQGQLLSETNDGVEVNTMTYDGYGNILTKNGKAYTYGDSTWKDLLMSYDGQSIAYDAQGNPTSYLGHTLAKENGNHGLMISAFWGFGLSIALSWTGFLSWRRTIYDMKGMSSSSCFGFTVYGIGLGVSLLMDSEGIAGVGLSVGVSLLKYGGYGAFVVADVIPLNRYVRLDKAQIKALIQNLSYSITMRIQNRLYGRYR